MEHNIEGSIPMTYDINYKGEVADVRLMHHLGFGCDEEAVRLVKLLHFTVPKLPRNLRVIFHKKLTIHFRLPKHPEKALESQGYNISYIQKPIQKRWKTPLFRQCIRILSITIIDNFTRHRVFPNSSDFQLHR
ncbi:MAG: energy transducer TonB [Saprospiraceae bacterium]|nr:energy transducer TonB [Saprospiraceae bacterium]